MSKSTYKPPAQKTNAVLRKPGVKLTPEMIKEPKRHPVMGADAGPKARTVLKGKRSSNEPKLTPEEYKVKKSGVLKLLPLDVSRDAKTVKKALSDRYKNVTFTATSRKTWYGAPYGNGGAIDIVYQSPEKIPEIDTEAQKYRKTIYHSAVSGKKLSEPMRINVFVEYKRGPYKKPTSKNTESIPEKMSPRILTEWEAKQTFEKMLNLKHPAFSGPVEFYLEDVVSLDRDRKKKIEDLARRGYFTKVLSREPANFPKRLYGVYKKKK